MLFSPLSVSVDLAGHNETVTRVRDDGEIVSMPMLSVFWSIQPFVSNLHPDFQVCCFSILQ